ncbi:MAG TPA: hypothetical protein VN709_02945 [Terriglobales bacterium]|nr:hypothetical protein [Terriglobales bacterium]
MEREWRQERNLGAMLVLTGWVALTRLALVAAMPGEPDSALFPVGLWRWVTAGPLATRVYDRSFSPGYYWLAAQLVRWGHIEVGKYIVLLNSISLIAALAMAPLAYQAARAYLPSLTAFWASWIWLLSPAVWWLGMEAHPQALGIALALGALVLQRHAIERGGGWWLTVYGALTAAWLVRCDVAFLYGAFLTPFAVPDASGRRAAADCRLGFTLAALAASGASFLVLRRVIVGNWRAASGAEPGTLRQISNFFGQLSPAHQALPFLTAGGVAATLLALAGVMWLPRSTRRRWVAIIALWSAPAAVFWIVVRGNNVRHVALCTLPLLWAGAAGWAGWRMPRRVRWHPVAVIAVAVVLLDCFLPVSANLTLYPTGNVPGAARALRLEEASMLSLAKQLARAPGGRCYFGSYTSAYLLYDVVALWAAKPSAGRLRFVADMPVTKVWTTPSPVPLVLHDVYSTGEYLRAQANCQEAYSLEYSRSGQPLHPLSLTWLR